MALDDGRGVGGDLLDIGAGFLVGHDLDVRAFLGERIAQALARRDEVAGGEERDGADLAGRQARLGVVAALILAVLVAEIVPVGAEIGEALGGRQVAVGDDGRHLLVDALVDLGGERVVPAADDDHAGRVLGALGVDGGDEGGEVDRGRAGDADLDVERLAGRLEARIDPLDEERQVRGVADPDIFLVAAARRRRSARSGPSAPRRGPRPAVATARQRERANAVRLIDVLLCFFAFRSTVLGDPMRHRQHALPRCARTGPARR